MMARLRYVIACVLLSIPILARPVHAQDTRPLHNTSYVPSDDQKIRQLVEEARSAADKKDHAAAADLLHRIILTPTDAVLPLRGQELFTSARRWAQMQLLAERAPFPRETLDAWRAAYDARGSAALQGAIASGDDAAIREDLDRYPACRAAPGALLALFDRAWQRGDRERARGFLLRLPEHLARSEEAKYLASPAVQARQKFARAASQDANEPAPLTAAPDTWPTFLGAADRARNGDPLSPIAGLKMLWTTVFLPSTPDFVDFDPPTRSSPQVPFEAICDKDRLYIPLGLAVAVLSRETGKLEYFAPGGTNPDAAIVDSMMMSNPGVRGATVHDGVLYFPTLRAIENPDRSDFFSFNELVAFDVRTRQVLWRCGRLVPRQGDAPVLRRSIFFRGAPAVAGGRVYAYGAIREFSDDGPTRKEEAYLFCFNAKDGRLVWHRFLGYGDTDGPARLPPLSGLAPAVSQGVVVAVSGVGVAAALDADTGDVIWTYRYSRQPMRERMRLSASREIWAPRRPGWKREAPRIVGDYVHFAPVDGDSIDRCWLRGRRRPEDGSFALVCWSQRRNANLGRNCLLEYVAGLYDGRGYYVGVRDPDRERWGYENVVSNDLRKEFPFRYARLPATLRPVGREVGIAPPLFGRPIIAGKTLLLPTRNALYAFDISATEKKGIVPLGRLDGPTLQHGEGRERPPTFGNLLSVGGKLYAVTRDRVICYGPR